MPAANYDLEIEQGIPYERVLFLKDAQGAILNLIGYTARMQVRPYVSSSDVLVELTTDNAGLVLDTVLGSLTIKFTELQTQALIYSKSLYDIELVDTALKPIRLLSGYVLVSPEVTR